jgi:hypothetical protein
MTIRGLSPDADLLFEAERRGLIEATTVRASQASARTLSAANAAASLKGCFDPNAHVMAFLRYPRGYARGLIEAPWSRRPSSRSTPLPAAECRGLIDRNPATTLPDPYRDSLEVRCSVDVRRNPEHVMGRLHSAMAMSRLR